MSKRIIALCDNVEAHEGHEVEGAEVVLALGPNGRATALDLCEPCRKQLVDPLGLLLTEYGQPVVGATVAHSGPTKKKGGPKVVRNGDGVRVVTIEGHTVEAPTNATLSWCPFPDCHYGTGPGITRQHLRDHCKRAHGGTPLPELEGQYGAVIDDQGTRVTLPHGCEQCPARFATPQGRGQHTKHMHAAR